MRCAGFPTTTRGLIELADWLDRPGAPMWRRRRQVVYWKPVWHIWKGRRAPKFHLIEPPADHRHNCLLKLIKWL